MVINPASIDLIFNPERFKQIDRETGLRRGIKPDLFENFLNQNNDDAIIAQQNYLDLNRTNLGTVFQRYLGGVTDNYPSTDIHKRYNIFEGAGGKFMEGFYPGQPPSPESLKNSFALEGSIYQPFA